MFLLIEQNRKSDIQVEIIQKIIENQLPFYFISIKEEEKNDFAGKDLRMLWPSFRKRR